MKFDFSKAKQNMIDCQIRPFSVIDEGVISAFSAISREEFVSNDKKPFAYADDHLDLGQGRLLMDPAIFARLVQALQVEQGDQILDLGCGCGYSSTILASLGASVTAADVGYWAEKAKANSQSSDKKAMRWVAVENPGRGCPEYGPYDTIMISGGVQSPPLHLVDQLRNGGKIATIYRDEQGHSQAVLFIKQDGDLVCQPLFCASAPILPEFEQENGFKF